MGKPVGEALGEVKKTAAGARHFAEDGAAYLPHDAPIALEEFFGPVAPFFTFKSDEEAIRLANDSEFGLGATVLSRNAERANHVASQLDAGAVSSTTLCVRTRVHPSEE